MFMENEFILSFYKEIAEINPDHHIFLVQHVESLDIFVKKTVSSDCLPLYTLLQKETFPHIPQIVELIPDEEKLIVIEEYIHGKNLEQQLAIKETYSPGEVCALVKALCRILQPLHSHDPQIIHRDIKPSNLILDNSGVLYLIDFDTSKQYDPDKGRDTVLMGTVEFAAPEQYGFGQSDARTDIYSMGILMHKLLTGSLPSQSRYQEGPLAEIIRKCTAIDPCNRFQSCTDLISALDDFLKEQERKQVQDAGTSQQTRQQEAQAQQSRQLRADYRPSQKTPPPLPPAKKKKPWQHAVAGILAVFCIYVSFTTDFTDDQNRMLTGYPLFMNQIGSSAALVLSILYFFNYFRLRDRFPCRHRQSRFSEVLRLAAGGFLCLLIPAGFVVLLVG